MLPYKNAIPVAAHRGNSKYFPENTMAAFRSAVALEPDMIEIDLHMTRDGHIVMMHDHKVDRTTNGEGLIREMTLDEIRALDAGSWKGEEFKGEKVPTFEEFLAFMQAYPDILLNVELKDYPAHSGDFAYESAEKSIALMRKYNWMHRATINTWSGELNEYLKEKYGDEIMIHAYYPQHLMNGKQKRFVLDYAYCVCIWGIPEKPILEKKVFDYCKSCGVEPWVYNKVDTPELTDEAVANGAMLFTSNDPKWLMDYLREKGLHK